MKERKKEGRIERREIWMMEGRMEEKDEGSYEPGKEGMNEWRIERRRKDWNKRYEWWKEGIRKKELRRKVQSKERRTEGRGTKDARKNNERKEGTNQRSKERRIARRKEGRKEEKDKWGSQVKNKSKLLKRNLDENRKRVLVAFNREKQESRK